MLPRVLARSLPKPGLAAMAAPTKTGGDEKLQRALAGGHRDFDLCRQLHDAQLAIHPVRRTSVDRGGARRGIRIRPRQHQPALRQAQPGVDLQHERAAVAAQRIAQGSVRRA